MSGAPFSWKALQAELAASAYLEPTDDVSTQRGLVATAIAITERMLRYGCNVPVRPVPLEAVAVDLEALEQAVTPAPSPSSDPPGEAAVQPPPPPKTPPGAPGVAVILPHALAKRAALKALQPEIVW